MIHQQNAMIPAAVSDSQDNPVHCFSAGDMVAEFLRDFRAAYGSDFFNAYLEAIRTNTRTDGRPSGPSSLIVYEDDQVLLFAPKAQVSEWELQIMTKMPCPHILAADTAVRSSIDTAMLKAVQALETIGAQMVTAVEFSGRFDGEDLRQHLVYSFIPRLPMRRPHFPRPRCGGSAAVFPKTLPRPAGRPLTGCNKETP